MIKNFIRWGLGLGAASAAAGIVLMILFAASPRSQAKAVDVMTKGADAVARLNSIHFVCQVRTLPADNFGLIMPQLDFVPIELWKQFNGDRKWRIDKPGRIAVMDGKSTLMFLKPANLAMKVQPTSAAFDTAWLHELANLSGTITSELRLAQARGWELKLDAIKAADGASKSVVTIEAKSGVPAGDYLKNTFFSTADTRRVYRFDDQTERLEAVEIYLHANTGDVLVVKLDQIDYDQTIDPAVFTLELPANVNWYQEPQKVANNERYEKMTPAEAARAFFEACGKEDWNEAGIYWGTPLDDRIKGFLGGLKLLNLGEPFTSAVSGAQFVPYEIQFKNGQTKKFNLALKKHPKTGRWFVDGGL